MMLEQSVMSVERGLPTFAKAMLEPLETQGHGFARKCKELQDDDVSIVEPSAGLSAAPSPGPSAEPSAEPSVSSGAEKDYRWTEKRARSAERKRGKEVRHAGKTSLSTASTESWVVRIGI
jgi:hypothetical protein